MGYGNNLTLMMKGNFTTMEPTFPSSGGPTLTVRGLNVLHKLRTKQFTYAWTDEQTRKRDRQEPRDAARPEPREDRSAFRCRWRSTTTRSAKSKRSPIVAQDNQYDIDFLLLSPARIGYVIFIKEEEQQNGRVIKAAAALLRTFRRQSSRPATDDI